MKTSGHHDGVCSIPIVAGRDSDHFAELYGGRIIESMFGKRRRRPDKQQNAELMQRYVETIELTASSQTNKQQMIEVRTVLQEILSKPGDEKKPIKEQEFVELRVDDLTDSWKPGFAVTEWRIRWSDVDQQFMWEDEQQEHWSTLQTAMNQYEARLRSLKLQGLTQSDLDF